MLRVVVDKNIDIPQLKKKLEKYLGVASRFMKLLKGAEGQEITCSLRWCKDDERITVKLERVLSEGEQRITVNHLVLSAPNVSISFLLLSIHRLLEEYLQLFLAYIKIITCDPLLNVL